MKVRSIAMLLLAGTLSLSLASAGSKDSKKGDKNMKKEAIGCCAEGKMSSKDAKHCDDKADAKAGGCTDGAKAMKAEAKATESSTQKSDTEKK